MKRSELARKTPLKQGSGPKEGRGFAASPAQRAKVKGHDCVICGRTEAWDSIKIDPAHLTPRSKGGCDDPLCVLALCREHHRQYDDGALDLLSVLAGLWPAYQPEVAHMLTHLSPVEMVEQLANARVEWRQG